MHISIDSFFRGHIRAVCGDDLEGLVARLAAMGLASYTAIKPIRRDSHFPAMPSMSLQAISGQVLASSWVEINPLKSILKINFLSFMKSFSLYDSRNIRRVLGHRPTPRPKTAMLIDRPNPLIKITSLGLILQCVSSLDFQNEVNTIS